MQAQQAPLIFTEAERPLGDRLLKMALETDRVEGYTEPHAVMIARLAETIGAQMGLHGVDLSALKFAALAHDIGERGMKRNYLLQPNALSWEETLDMWRHPILGEQSAAELHLPRQTQLLIRWHHEWWNGQGYPDGLAGAAIPLGARILRAVDTYCALISRRPHRQNYELLDAEQIIADLAGIEFDPQIVKRLLELVVAERRQREAESWPAAHATEPAYGWQPVQPAEEVTAPPPEFDAEPETPAPAHSPEADTLEMAAVGAESPMTVQPADTAEFAFPAAESGAGSDASEPAAARFDSPDLAAAAVPDEAPAEIGAPSDLAEPHVVERHDGAAEPVFTPAPAEPPLGEDRQVGHPTPAETDPESAQKV